MELTYSEKKLIVAIVVQELADIDPRDLKVDEWDIDILPSAARKLAYWLGQNVTTLCLDEAQEALCNLARCADGTDLEFEGLGTGRTHAEWREYFDAEYESEVICIIGVEPRG